MEHSPTARLIAITTVFTVLLIVTFVAFSVSGVRIRSVPIFSGGFDEVSYDAPPAPIPTGPPGPPADRPFPPWQESVRPVGVPETTAEEIYYAAVRKQDDQVRRTAERLAPRERLRTFLEDPLGKELQVIAAIARRGRVREAYVRLQGLIPRLEDQDLTVRGFALKFAIRLYELQNDREGLKDAVRSYLQAYEDWLQTPEGQRAEGGHLDENVRDLKDLMAKLEGEGSQ